MPLSCVKNFGKPKDRRCMVIDEGMATDCDCKYILDTNPLPVEKLPEVNISVALMLNLMEWSQKVFKFGRRWKSILGHIEKELIEIEKVEGMDPVEWADVTMLGMDGLWRCLAANHPKLTDEQIAKMAYKVILDKLELNKLRVYPTPVDQTTPVEHIR